jgi:hypothetical protein
MHFFMRRVFFGLLTLTAIASSGQNSLFAPYDCRDEVEIMAQMERERRLREQAILDSLEDLQRQEAMLRAELEMQFREDTLNGWKTWATVNNFSFGKNRGSLPMISDLAALHPYFRDKVIELINRCERRGIHLAIVESYRTHAKQSEYKNMGRKYTRSGAGKSKHQYGLAIDVVPLVNGEPQWNNKHLWRRIGVIGEQLGLRWGGRWRSLYDPGHFEWTGGLNAYDLARGKTPYIPKQETHYPCIDEDLRLLTRYWSNWESEQSSYARVEE